MGGVKIMKLFKTEDNQIFAYELDGSQDYLIGDKTPITQEEADAIIASRPVIINPNYPKPTDEELA
jgi:2,4-dienoyl-CoA reductase-like NADH-dependent reductase (Old Yellow Enzyme family)